MRKTVDVSLLPRGVWQAPYFGPTGELVLLAVTSKHWKWREVVVPHGASRVVAAESLEADLDAFEPPPPKMFILRGAASS